MNQAQLFLNGFTSAKNNSTNITNKRSHVMSQFLSGRNCDGKKIVGKD